MFDNSAMSGIFGSPMRRQNYSAPPSTPPPPTSDGRIMPAGNMGLGAIQPPVNDGPQNTYMPQGAPDGQPQQPLTQADYSSRAPVMNPNNNYMLDALKSGSLNPSTPDMSVGTPQANTPGINMQNTPFFTNQLRSRANAPMMGY